jgi:hypothetical protein
MPCTQCSADIDIHDGDIGCSACAPNGSRCPGCDEHVPDGSSCDDCVTCDRCQDTVPDAETIETLRGSTICRDCRRAYYWQCGECDGWNRDGRDCANECCSDDCDCSDCRNDDDDDDRGGLVYDYYYKPSPVFHGTGPLFLGPEIEIETPSRDWDCAEIAHSYLGSLGYLKNDTSIGHGFEIVTHPMSYRWAIAHFPWPMLARLREEGCYAGDRTGIHVHVSRAGFSSPCHAYRWMKFLYRNQHHVTAVARRSCPQWAAFTDDDRKAVKDYAKGACGDRYRAINTNNTDTFELRIFASSLNPDEVQAALAFTAASVDYTRDLTVTSIAHHGGWSWHAFVDWLAARPSYQPLTTQMEALACAC